MTTCARRSAAAVFVAAIPILVENGYCFAKSRYENLDCCPSVISTELDSVSVFSSDLDSCNWTLLICLLVSLLLCRLSYLACCGILVREENPWTECPQFTVTMIAA